MKKLVSPSVVEKTVRNHGIVGDYEVGVYQASEEEMRKLWDGQPHDVLSFPLDGDTTYPDGVVRLGDIVICDQEKDIESLAEHGCMHLLGIHHE